MTKRFYATLAGVVGIILPRMAWAAQAAGAMPYSTYMGMFRTSLTGEIAGIICLIAVIGGVYVYIRGSGMDGLFDSIVKVIIGVAIIGGAATYITTLGATGAVI